MYYCDDDDDGDDANDFVYHWLDGAVDFVDLMTITMDHNVVFRYLNHF